MSLSSGHVSDVDDRPVDEDDTHSLAPGEVVLSFNPRVALGLLVKGVTMTLLAGLKELPARAASSCSGVNAHGAGRR